jgi:hypothetical protein
MPIKSNTESFIKKAILRHGNKYDYSLVVYIKSNKLVNIICRIHNKSFPQTPNMHLKGSGCPNCGNLSKNKSNTSNTESFIKKAIKKHKNKYDYSLVKYVISTDKVEIKCLIHGIFEQSPSAHLSGGGCLKCGNESQAKKKSLTQKEFIKKANSIHHNKYNYDLTIYASSKDKIKIMCQIHGEFEQIAGDHLNGHGCLNCGKKKANKSRTYTIEKFINKANKKHKNKYDYSSVNYVNSTQEVIILCPKHGIFEQAPVNHLRGYGCKKCSNSISNLEIKWLDHLGIPQIYRQINFHIGTLLIKTDAYDHTTKTVYEFYGDYYHGNLNIYDQNEINERSNKTYGELYDCTMERERIIKEAGYFMKTIWETDFKKLNL